MHPYLAILLGAIQGATEFIPVSSSAHLAIMHRLFPHETADTVLFDVMLHLGTLVALLAYFWRDWADIFKANLAKSESHGEDVDNPALKGKAMPLWPLILACIPGVIFGILFEKRIEKVLDNPLIIATTIVMFGIIMVIADKSAKKVKPMQRASLKDWIFVGCAQALAIIPGVSRSGVTISAGLLRGFQREAAARFSFLLGAPIILGAALFEARKLIHTTSGEIIPMLLGLISSALVGYVSIGYLIEYLKKRGLLIYSLYRFGFAIVVLVIYALGGLR